MLNLSLFDLKTEPEKYKIAEEFNKIYDNFPKVIAEWSYYELWERTEKVFPLSSWKDFMLDKRVRTWFSEELDLALRTNLQHLAKTVGNDRSTATQQALTAILKHQETNTPTEEQNVIFVYTFVPLTTIEENLPNVRTLETIPKEIGRAIRVNERDSK